MYVLWLHKMNIFQHSSPHLFCLSVSEFSFGKGESHDVFYFMTYALRWQLSRETNFRCKSMKATVLLMKLHPQLQQKNSQFRGQGKSHWHIILHWWEPWLQTWRLQRNLQHRYEGIGPVSTVFLTLSFILWCKIWAPERLGVMVTMSVWLFKTGNSGTFGGGGV